MDLINILYVIGVILVLFLIGFISGKYKWEKQLDALPSHIKITLINSAIILILTPCFFKIPYGYYDFVRFSIFGLGVFSSLFLAKRKQYLMLIYYIPLAILFNPIIKIGFSKSHWELLDLLAIASLLALTSILILNKKALNQFD